MSPHGARPFTTVLYRPLAKGASIRLTRNTCVSAAVPSISFWFIGPLDPDAASVAKPIALDASDNLFDSPAGLFVFEQNGQFLEKAKPLPLPEAQALLRRVLSWRERHNLYACGDSFLTWSLATDPNPLGKLKTLAEWNSFWRQTETKSLEGRPLYEGGNLRGKSIDQLTPEDFRLRPDSAGYRAGENGRDLGADVDLVGPGPAYERWKKTPEYQQWLKQTGQVKGE